MMSLTSQAVFKLLKIFEKHTKKRDESIASGVFDGLFGLSIATTRVLFRILDILNWRKQEESNFYQNSLGQAQLFIKWFCELNFKL